MSHDPDISAISIMQIPPFTKPAWNTIRLVVRRSALTTIIVMMAIAILVLVSISPLALKEFGSLHGIDWSRLSNIGQTYGAASALLTGLALIGVAASMIFQVRAIQATREQSSREHHAHLVEMALTDPAYQRCWGEDPTAFVSSDSYRQNAYLNLILSYWERDYKLGDLPKRELRIALAEIFRGEAARRFWAKTGHVRRAINTSWKSREFVQIIDDEYRKAQQAGPPAVPAAASPSNEKHSGRPDCRVRTGAAVALAVIGGAVLADTVRRLLAPK